MSRMGLSVIIPMYNAESWIIPTVNHIFDALKGSGFEAEIIIVDDGSTDEGVREVKSIKRSNVTKLKLIEQENKGRYLARKVGVEAAKYDNILFVDSRVFIDQGSLHFLATQLQDNKDQIWNGHVNIDKKGNIFARFWDAIVHIAWRKYFKRPETTQYGIDEFDYYPKGTGFFFTPKKHLLAAMKYFEKQTSDLRFSSDDTLLIRYMIKRTPIHLSPEFSCLYHGRSTLKKFLTHAYDRGQFFIDGFLRPGTRFYIPLIGVLALSIIFALLLFITPLLTIKIGAVGLILLVLSLFVGAVCLGVSIKDATSLATLGVPFALVYLGGLWRGVVRKATSGSPRMYLKLAIDVITKQRNILRGSIAEYILATVGFLAVAAVLTKGVLFNLGDQIYATIGDATAGFMWLNYAEPGLNLILSHTDDVNYPVGEAVGGPTFIAYSAIWLPIRILSYLFGPIAGLNLVMYIGFISAAMAGYWLIKRLTGNLGIAIFAGYAIAFTPYALFKSSGHIAYIFSGVFVLIIAAFMGLWRQPTVTRGGLFAAAIALAFYTDGYYVLLASVTVIACVLGGLLYGVFSKYVLRDYFARLKGLLVALGALLIFLAPLGLTQMLHGAQVSAQLAGARSSISSELNIYRSNVIDFLLPSEYHPLTAKDSDFHAMFNYKIQRSNSSESMNYIGYVVLLFVAFGLAVLIVWLFFRKSLSVPMSDNGFQNFILVACIATVAVPLMLAFMFSPGVTVFGHHIPLFGQLFIDYDISLWRVMSRFFVPLHVILVIFAAMSLYVLYRYIMPVSDNKGRLRKITAYCMIGFALLFTAFEYYVDIPNRPYSFSKDMPHVYSWLKDQQDIKVIAELPLVDPLDQKTAGYVSSQIIHNKKIINFKDPNPARLNAALGDQSNEEVINLIEARGANAVLIRGDVCKSYDWGKLVYYEKNPDKRGRLVCVYRLHEHTVDDAFVVYGDGFTPSPNAPDQSVAVFSTRGRGELHITGSDLNTHLRAPVTVSALLGNHTGEELTWTVSKSGKVLQQGKTHAGGLSTIGFVADETEAAIQITVNGKSPIQLGQLTLDEVVATDATNNVSRK